MLKNIRAIDVHVHPPPEGGALEIEGSWREYLGKAAPPPVSVEDMAAKYEELGILGVLLAIDARTTEGNVKFSNDYIASIVSKYPHCFVGFGSVDPWLGKLAIYEIERSVKELGLKGIKFVPYLQEFFVSDPKFYPIWEKCQELKIPVTIHTGMMFTTAGMPGGGGLRLKFCRPIPYIDDLAANFPELTIIMAHPAWPWQEEQLAVCLHKGNAYMDLAGWSPKYFSPALIQYANTRLKDKVMFGSDYTAVAPEKWLKDFENAPFNDEVRPKILLENAKRVLGIT